MSDSGLALSDDTVRDSQAFSKRRHPSSGSESTNDGSRDEEGTAADYGEDDRRLLSYPLMAGVMTRIR
ncbi:hypothetical protein SAY87_027004 [Trapa incisa]|uniref:Uncharacterized protein n=1 Tax=Trapa incisa TaxID=236973 RepID=A0AAN7GMP0_9MYRT|nr:hypothetical protein SAY87_027004 [Trapa incisa]